jgi:hypothetical protein
LFFVDEGLDYNVGGYTRFYRPYDSPTRIRAATADGRLLWEHVFHTQELVQVAADQFGGVVMVLKAGHDDNDAPLAAGIRRLDGLTGAVTWEYLAELEYGVVSEVAIRPDGMVFFTDVDGHSRTGTLVGIEGATGATHTWPLAGGHYTRYHNDVVMEDHDTAAQTTGPIVREDGSVLLVAKRASTVVVVPGEWHADGTWYQTGASETPLRERDFELITLADTSGAPPVVHALNASVLSDPERDTWRPSSHRLMPDGQGGYLLTGGVTVNPAVTTAVRRIDPNLVLSAPFDPLNGSTRAVYQADFVLGEDGAWSSFETYGDNSYCTGAVRFDPTTLGVLTDTVLACTPQPQHLQLRSALEGGGIYLSGPYLTHLVGAVVSGEGFGVGGNATQPVNRLWPRWTSVTALNWGSSAPLTGSQRGSPRGEGNRNAPLGPFDTYEKAALAALDDVYKWSRVTEWEWGGLICEQGTKFLWSGHVTEQNQSQVNVAALASCNRFGPLGRAVARYHTHPPKEENPLPSPGDLTNANEEPSIAFYLRAAVGPASAATLIWKYRRTDSTLSQDNAFTYETSAEQWIWRPHPWQYPW